MIKGTTRPVPPPTLKLDLRASIHNRFDVEVYDAATGELKQKAQAFNVICNTFWSRLLNVSNGKWTPLARFNYVIFGGGSGTPSAADTVLFSRIGSRSVSTFTDTNDRRTGVASRQAVATLNAEDNVGAVITELGIGYDSTHITTHALLQDMNGNPISIEKTDTDVIKIYATIFVHWPDGGWYGGSVNFASVFETNYGFLNIVTGYHPDVYYYVTNLKFSKAGKCTTEPVYNNNNVADTQTHTVDTANKKVTAKGRFAAATANLPIRAVYLFSYFGSGNGGNTTPILALALGNWYTAPAISGEAVGTGTGAKTGFATAFPVKTGGAVYVDGVAASDVTVRSGPADATNMEQWFNMLNGTRASGGALSASGAPLYYYGLYSSELTSDGLHFSLGAQSYKYAYENPFYALGISKFRAKRWYGDYPTAKLLIQASDDCASWSDVGEVTVSSGTNYVDVNVPAALKNKRFFRFKNNNASGGATAYYEVHAVADVADTASNIIFQTAPASGAVITADYTPDCVAKDSNHVFDMEVSLTFGEYQGD